MAYKDWWKELTTPKKTYKPTVGPGSTTWNWMQSSKKASNNSGYGMTPVPEGTVKGNDTFKSGQWVPNVAPTNNEPYFQQAGSGSNNYYESVKGLNTQLTSDQEDLAEQQRKAEEERIRGIYSGLIDTYRGYEDSLRERLPILEGQISQSYDEVLPKLQLEQSNRITGLEGQQANIEQTGKSQVNAASRLFNELQSAGQKYSGTSVGDAYGELLGRSTSETIGNARQYVAQQSSEIQKEMGAVNTYYDSKRTELEENKQLSLREARSSFEDEIRKIQSDIRAAEGDKANARADALSRYYSNLSQIKQASYLENVALEKWKASQDQTLSSAQNAVFKNFVEQSLSARHNDLIQMYGLKPVATAVQQASQGNYGSIIGLLDDLPNQDDFGYGQQGSPGIMGQVPNQQQDPYADIDRILMGGM
jgi:hypothetical protein